MNQTETQTATPSQEEQLPLQHFLVAGEIEYQEGKLNKATKFKRVDGIYATTGEGIIAKDLAGIQGRLQHTFRVKRSQVGNEETYRVVGVVVQTCSFLGTFTQAQFMAGAPGTEPKKHAMEPTPVTKEEVEADIAENADHAQ